MLPVKTLNLPGKPHTTKEPLIRPAARAWTGLSLLLIGLLTLWPIPAQAPLSAATPFFCFPCGDHGVSDLLLNLMLFVPLGFALALGGMGLLRAAILAAATTGLVELLQLTVIAGRDASAADLLANTAGAAVGWWAGQVRATLLFPGPARAAAAAVTWAGVGIASALLTGGSLPHSLRATTWYGQWAPGDPEPEWFSGEVLAVELGHRPLPHGRQRDSDGRRTELAGDTARLAARIVSMPPPEDGLRIVALADSAGRMITLTQRGRDLSFAIRTRAAELFLQSPVFRVPGGMPAVSGDTLMVEGVYWRGWARLQGHGSAVSPLDGWSLLLPAAQGSPAAAILTVGWLVLLFAPTGFYAGQVRGSGWAVVTALLLLAVPVMVAWTLRTPLPAAWEVVVGAAAALSGRMLGTGLAGRRHAP